MRKLLALLLPLALAACAGVTAPPRDNAQWQSSVPTCAEAPDPPRVYAGMP